MTITVAYTFSFKEDTVNRLGRILQLIGQFSFVPTVQLQSHMYSSLLLLIRTARQKEGEVFFFMRGERTHLQEVVMLGSY